MLATLVVLSLLCALLTVFLVEQNLRIYTPPPAVTGTSAGAPISVLIPARDEEGSIRDALASVLHSEGVELEVVVLDDGSTDRTAEIVREIAAGDPRVRLETAPPLPPGWSGKMHACHCLAGHARFSHLLFVDADVRLAPDALARVAPLLQSADLISGVPRQITGTFSEKLLIPLIHFVLLGYLPLARMRASRQPSLGAGCGQFMLTTATAYRTAGGHGAARTSIHDGLHLPRLYRRAGLRTDLTDLTPLATCRMYRTNGATWAGLAKNAHEGMGAWASIFPMSFLLFMGQVMPFALVVIAFTQPLRSLLGAGAWVAAICAFGARARIASRFQQSGLGALLHPVGIAALLGIQWWARLRHSFGGASSWKGRIYRGA